MEEVHIENSLPYGCKIEDGGKWWERYEHRGFPYQFAMDRTKWLLVTKINISLVYPYSNTVAPNDLLKHLYFEGKVKQRNMRKCTYNEMFNKL